MPNVCIGECGLGDLTVGRLTFTDLLHGHSDRVRTEVTQLHSKQTHSARVQCKFSVSVV